MGFYLKDLYVDVGALRRTAWRDLFHDPLTNPHTVPETSPAIAVAALSPAIAGATGRVLAGDLRGVEEVAMGIGVAAMSAYLPAFDDGVAPPSRISPIADHLHTLLDESDLLQAREALTVALGQVDAAVDRLRPTGEDLDVLRAALDPPRVLQGTKG